MTRNVSELEKTKVGHFGINTNNKNNQKKANSV